MKKVYFAEELSREEFLERMRKAMESFKKTSHRLPDKIVLANVKLPRIRYQGKEIDLAKAYPGAAVIATSLGKVPYLPYFARKGKDQLRDHVHFFDRDVYLAYDPDDGERWFICFGEKTKITDRGLEG